MPFFDSKEGTLTFEGGLSLQKHMSSKTPATAMPEGNGEAVSGDPCEMLFLPVQSAGGGFLSPVCIFREDRLVEVSLHVKAVGQRAQPTADQQRAFLFSLINAKDPCPDTKRNVRLRCGFGEVSISTDPRLGSAVLRLTYHA